MRSSSKRSRLFAAVVAATRQIASGLRAFFVTARVPALCERIEGRVLLSATDPFGTGSHYFDQAPFSTAALDGEVAQANPNAVGTTDAAVSASGVRYFDGVPEITATDLSSNGFGQIWGVTRTYSSDMTGAGSLGNHWYLNQLPQLVQEGTHDANQPAGATGTIILVGSAYDQRWFDDISSTWTERYGGQDTLAAVTYSGKSALELTTTSGQSIYFYDFSSGNGAQKGQFIASTDAYGNVTSVTSTDASGDITEVQRANGSDIESWLYTYNTPGGVITNIQLRRSTNSGSTFTVIDQAAYAYYTTGDAGGNTGDLKSVTTEDGAGNPISTTLYRYWLGTETVDEGGSYITQPADAIKYVFSGESYARLAAYLSSGTPDSASDADLQMFANSYFTYTSSGQVYTATVAGQGGTSTGGMGTFTYAYLANTNAGYTKGVGTWAEETTETLPDGNSTSVYSSYLGEPLLTAVTSGSTSWGTFREFNSSGWQTLEAEPSAMTLPSTLSTLNTNNDVLNSQSGNYQYLSDDSGLVYTTAYYSGTPTATSSTPGTAAGYFESTSLQQGEEGTAVLQETRQYLVQSGSSLTIYPVGSDEVYTGAGGSGGETTTTSYTWFSSTDQPQTETVTLPAITTGDAPSGSDKDIYTFDQYNWPTLFEDGDSYYTATTYDIPTGATTQTITDSGSVGHLNLTTDYTVDGLGRPTEITSPDSNVTYIIYNDPAHQTSTYEGWHSIGGGDYTSTGPVQVSRTYYPAANASAGCQTLYFETLTFNPPVEASSTPAGNETINSGDIQSLSRQLSNPAGQIDELDTYFSLSGVTYGQAAAQLGSSSNNSATGNYYATLYGFDDRGNENHVEDPTGTITDTTFNVLDLPVSVAVGTNDGGSNNMVTTESDDYDQRGPAPSSFSLSQSGSGVTGGTTYYVKVTYLGPAGESLTSSELSLLVHPGNQLVVHSPSTVAGFTGYNVYVATSSGAEQQQNSAPVSLGTNWTQPTAGALIAGSLLPLNQVGDGDLTESIQYVDTTAADNRETLDLYDFEDREVAEKDGAQSVTESTSVHRPIYLYTLDNLGEVTAQFTYDSDTVSIFDFGNGQPSSHSSSLRAQVLNSYDAQQRLYQSQQYEVNQGSGAVSATNILTTAYYWDNRNLLVAESDPGGQWLKHSYDGAGRDIEDSTTDGGALNGTPASYSAASTTSNDVVVEQTDSTLDADGNVIETLDRQRFDNDPSTATGDLDGPSGGNLASRDYYTDYYFDDADRQIDEADIGTNGGSAWSRPGSPDSDSSTYLLTGDSYSADTVQTVSEVPAATGGSFTLSFGAYATGAIAYNALSATVQSDLVGLTSVGSGNISVTGPAGGPYVVRFIGSFAGDSEPLMTDTSALSGSTIAVSMAAVGGDNGNAAASTDPAGNGSFTDVNLAGQTVQTVSGAGGSASQSVLDTYDGDGDLLTTTAENSGSVNQTTAYQYAAGGTVGTNIFSNNLQTAVGYPDPTTGLAGSFSATSGSADKYTYNWAGQETTYTDRNDTQHAYSYDSLGREIMDSVSSFGAGVDTTVQSLGYTYTSLDLPSVQTSYSGTSGSGTTLNSVTDSYNGFGQITSQADYFSSGTGWTSGSVSGAVSYVYNETANGTANNSRLLATVDPDGRVVETDYSPQQDPVTGITHSGTTATATTTVAISGLITGQTIVISGASPAAYDGTFTVGTVSGATFTYTLGSTPGSNASGSYMSAAVASLDQTISRPDGLQDKSTGIVLEGYTYLGLNTIVQESHPQTGIDLTYISQSGDTSAPPAYAATGGDRYVGLDQFGRVDDQFYVNPSTVTSPTDRFQYSYDLDGNLLYKDVTEMGGTAATYSQLYHASAGLDSAAYDGQNRLTSFSQGTLSNTNAGNGSVLDTVASPTLTEGFTLDSVGNWDTFSNSSTGGETRTFNAQNEITNNSGSTTPTYDYDGNMTKNDGGATLVYNAWNQLVSYNGSVAQYEYLPGGQRASATTCSTGNTQFSYFSTDWQDLEDDLPPAGSGGSVQATTYVWGLENVNELVERDSSAGVRLYAQHDANMDVTALLSTGGTVVERFSYDPYGVATVLNASWATTSDAYNWTYRWQGGLYDLTTGLYSFQRRDYSPTLGTWLENDPAGYIDGPNTYQAMLGAPIEKTDPYGLTADSATGSTVNSSGATPAGGSGSREPGAPGSPVFGPPAPIVSVTEPPPPTSQPAPPPTVWGPLGPFLPAAPPAVPPMAGNAGPKGPFPPGTTVTPGQGHLSPTTINFPDGSELDTWPDPAGLETPEIIRLDPGGHRLPPLPGDKPTVLPEVLRLPPYQPTPTPPKNPIIIRIPLPFLGGGGWTLVYNPLKPEQVQVTGTVGGTDVHVTGGYGNAPKGVTNGRANGH